ncbi:MAG: helix-hairpin-helix domain-containing protein [Saprospiraceae bacterium]|nr:helix-hairpin-helix domain-containing protein [Saprospiraceae bacterium]
MVNLRFFAKSAVFMFLLLPLTGRSQQDSLPAPGSTPLEQVIEDALQNEGGEGDFDFNTLFENLEAYAKRPLNLNKADENALRELQLLTDVQIMNLLQYRIVAGELVDLHELQAVPGFDLATIRRLLPYVGIGNAGNETYTLRRFFREGDNELFLSWSRVLEPQKGYEPAPNGYTGDPNRLYLRYKHSLGNRMSIGFTAEKDRGEAFFKGSNPNGFDYYSAHFFLSNPDAGKGKILKALAIGDYAVSFGHGLMLFSGFGAGKSALVTTLKRNARTLRPYTSVNEANFMRGAAATLAFSDRLEFTAFTSLRKRDGNLVLQNDTTGIDSEFRELTSFDIDGLHRTPAEIADENAAEQFTLGGSLKYKISNGHLAVNALYDQFDKPLNRTPQAYNRFYFNGDRLLNASIDYSWVWRNVNFFGETATSDNGAVATLNGVLIGLDRKVDMAMLFRHYPRHYQALNADPFGETTGGRNETGLYTGIVIRPAANWILSGYFDLWQHPWLRFDADAPSKGHEYRIRVTHFRKRRYEAFAEFRNEVKEINVPEFESQVNRLAERRQFQVRLQFNYQVSKALEWRSRVDAGFVENEVYDLQQGFAIYQDLIYQPIASPISFTTRFALFDTDGYAVRFYAYENNLLYTFSIPPYYNQGMRFYLNCRYRLTRALTVEGRFEQTYWKDQETVGSSLEETDRPTRSLVSMQMRYKF